MRLGNGSLNDYVTYGGKLKAPFLNLALCIYNAHTNKRNSEDFDQPYSLFICKAGCGSMCRNCTIFNKFTENTSLF